MPFKKHTTAATTTTKKSPAEALHAAVDSWWRTLHRAIVAQLVCSLLMQVSYVAFPAYNFAIALWCLVSCTPKWMAKHPRLAVLVLGAVGVSVVTDIVWLSLWVSGRVFYDQFCGSNGVSIVSCGGASDYFPGCATNRFALLMMLLNDVAKIVLVCSVARVHALRSRVKKSGDDDAKGVQVSSSGEDGRSGQVHQVPTAEVVPERDDSEKGVAP